MIPAEETSHIMSKVMIPAEEIVGQNVYSESSEGCLNKENKDPLSHLSRPCPFQISLTNNLVLFVWSKHFRRNN